MTPGSGPLSTPLGPGRFHAQLRLPPSFLSSVPNTQLPSEPSTESPPDPSHSAWLPVHSPTPLLISVLLDHLRAESLTCWPLKPETRELAVTPYFPSSRNLIQYQVLSIASPLGLGPELIFLWNYCGVLVASYSLQFLPHTSFQQEAFLEGKSDPISSLLKKSLGPGWFARSVVRASVQGP